MLISLSDTKLCSASPADPDRALVAIVAPGPAFDAIVVAQLPDERNGSARNRALSVAIVDRFAGDGHCLHGGGAREQYCKSGNSVSRQGSHDAHGRNTPFTKSQT